MPLLTASLTHLCLIWIVVRLSSGQSRLSSPKPVPTKTSFARTSLKYDGPVGKVSFAPEISVEDLDKIIQVHNQLRAQQGAADMQLLRWHSFLATLAEEWVDLCNWTHGQLSQDPNVRTFQSVGQSMYASRSASVDAAEVIRLWYSEEASYDLQTRRCTDGNLCHLYTQVVWSSSREIGCAIRQCDNLKVLNWRNASFLVCNYAPSGGWPNEEPFRIGKACTKCATGGLWCETGLCNSFCQRSGLQCFCFAKCDCGILNPETCSCNCKVGWHGPDCSEACFDRDRKCSTDPSWSLSSCSENDETGRMVRRTCPATCRLCQAANSSVPSTCISQLHKPAFKSGQHPMIPSFLLLCTVAAAGKMLTLLRFSLASRISIRR